jgi:predicted MPP superfamily phosphohydrolase
MRAFLLIVTSILATVWLFVWFRLVAPAQLPIPAQLAIALLLLVAFALQPSRWIFKSFFHDRVGLQLFTYLLLGLMAHTFIATLIKDLLLLPWHFTAYQNEIFSLHGRRVASLAAFTAALLGNLVGVITAKAGPRVKEVSIKLPHWPAGAAPFRLAQISDLHVSSLIRRPYVEKVVAKLNTLGADAVAITGDLGDGFAPELKHDLAPLAEIKSKQGVFYVTGNHEYYWNSSGWMQAGRELGFSVLFNEGKKIPLSKGHLWIGGVPDYTAGSIQPGHESLPEKAMPDSQEPMPKILLAHQPKSVFAAGKAGFDLMLSGHTHNGQFFPINLIVGRFNPYSKGLNQHGAMQVYVNVGTGYWGPPQRLFVPAEISLLTLHG